MNKILRIDFIQSVKMNVVFVEAIQQFEEVLKAQL